jgi:hypothetical protein
VFVGQELGDAETEFVLEVVDVDAGVFVVGAEIV